MLVVGLTGGIGSGKSTVADMFALLGTPIIDADIIARDITLPGKPAFQAIVDKFGPDILQNDGTLNRAKLRALIFTNANERLWLENLLHPLIRDIIQKHVCKLTNPYCIVVIPLLFEVEPYPFIQRILVVDAPEQAQIERVMARDQSEQAKVEAILRAQTSRELRLAKANDVIINDGSIANLTPKIQKLHELYLSL